MSGILLDTNALLWLLSDDRRLGVSARSELSRARRVHVSSVSVLEVTIKQLLGKLELPGDLQEATAEAGLVELPLTAAHAATLASFPDLVRHDPFDRMLLAQVRAEDLVLLTSDRTLLDLGSVRVLDARA